MTIISNAEALATIAVHRAREAGDRKALEDANIALGMVRAEEAMNRLTPEQRAKVLALYDHSTFITLLEGVFVGPPDSKGRQVVLIHPEVQHLTLRRGT